MHSVRSRTEEVCRTSQGSGGGAAASRSGCVRPTLVHTSVQHHRLHRQDQGEPPLTLKAVSSFESLVATEQKGVTLNEAKKAQRLNGTGFMRPIPTFEFANPNKKIFFF